jgi:lysozyme family protein
MPTPKEDLKETIAKWEGLFQKQSQDRGNYTSDGRLVGTMRGVTPQVLAAHRGIPQDQVTEEVMRSVSLDEAAAIGETRFYRGTGLDLLPWGPATAALVDIGWGSGPRQACLIAQELSGLKGKDIDGDIGPKSVKAYTDWIRQVGWRTATAAVAARRRLLYQRIVAAKPDQAIYLQGWTNRANWMEADTPWFARWAEWPLPEHVMTPSGTQPDPKPVVTAADSATTTRDANQGSIQTGILTTIGAGAPIVTAASGMDWKLALVFSGAAVLIGVVVLIYFLRIKNKQVSV